MAFSFLDPVLSPFLLMPPFWGILVLTGLLTVILTLVYKWTTDQVLMKQLKDDLAAFQKEMKENKSDTDKVFALQKKAMDANMKYMMESFKPTLFTFLPMILIFGWLAGHYAFEPILVGEEFNVTGQFSPGTNGTIKLMTNTESGLNVQGASEVAVKDGKSDWKVKAGKEGKQYMTIEYLNKTYSPSIRIGPDRTFEEASLKINEGGLNEIIIGYRPLTVMTLYWDFGWFGTYFIFTLVFSILFRKVLNVY